MTKALNVVADVTELAQSYETEQEKVAILEGEVTRLTKEQATTRELNAELRRLNDSLRRNVEQARKELRDIGEERGRDFPLWFTMNFDRDTFLREDIFRVTFNQTMAYRIRPEELVNEFRSEACKRAFVETIAKKLADELAKSLYLSIEKSAQEHVRKNYRASDFF